MNLKHALPLGRGRACSRGRQRQASSDKKPGHADSNKNELVMNRRSPTWTTVESDSQSSESSWRQHNLHPAVHPPPPTCYTPGRGDPAPSPRASRRSATPRKGGEPQQVSPTLSATKSFRIFCGTNSRNSSSEELHHWEHRHPLVVVPMTERLHDVVSPVTVDLEDAECPNLRMAAADPIPDWAPEPSWTMDHHHHHGFRGEDPAHVVPEDGPVRPFASTSSSCHGSPPQAHQRAVINTSRASALPSTLSLTSAGERDGVLSVGDGSSVSGDSFGCKVGCLPVDAKQTLAKSLEDDSYWKEGTLLLNDVLKEAQPKSLANDTIRSSSQDSSFLSQQRKLVLQSMDDARRPSTLTLRAKSDEGPLAVLPRRMPAVDTRVSHGSTRSLGRGDMVPLAQERAGQFWRSMPIREVEMVVRRETETEYSECTLQRETRSFGEGAAIIMSTMMNSALVQLPEAEIEVVDQSFGFSSAWGRRVKNLILHHGKDHIRVADAFIDLGIAQLHASCYLEATQALESAVAIYRPRKTGSSMALARALHQLGMAYHKMQRSNDSTSTILFTKSLRCLGEALKIRFENLGPMHPDTAAIVNCLGGVYMTAQDYNEARRSYMEVLMVRQAVFGILHPSVAVAAHSLANALVQLGNLEEATIYYFKALDIYEALDLRQDHPSLSRLLRDLKRMERLQET